MIHTINGVRKFYLVDFFKNTNNYRKDFFVYDKREFRKLREEFPAPFGKVTEFKMKRYTRDELTSVPFYDDWPRMLLRKNGFQKEGFISLLDDSVPFTISQKEYYSFAELESLQAQIKDLLQKLENGKYNARRELGKEELLKNKLNKVEKKFNEINGGNKNLIIFRSNYVSRYPFAWDDFWDGIFFFSIGTYYEKKKLHRKELIVW